MQLLFFQEWSSHEIVKAIGWTLIHSLWQGVIAAVLAGIIIISTKRTAARHRYNLLGLVLLLFTMAAVITFSQQLNGSAGRGKILAEPSIMVTGNIFIENYYQDPGTGSTTLERFVRYFNANTNFIVLIWAILFLFHCIKLFTGLAGIRRIRNYRTEVSSGEWRGKLVQLSNVLGLKQTAGLFQSEIIRVPVAIGFFKPVILVPLGLLSNLPAEQVETILLHELAHIRRNDYLVNIMQRFIEAVFFFNPALLWVSSLLRQEREACCDDIVVANTTHKGTYLQALVSFQEYSFAGSRYAMAINSKQHYLLNRVKRMITRENKKLDVMEKIILIAGLFAVTAFTFIPKKDAIKKPDPAIAGIVGDETLVASIPAKHEVLAVQVRKTGSRKDYKKPPLEIQESILLMDTVPPAKKMSENKKPEYNDLKFPTVSSSVNDDGNTRTESTTVIDGNGKKYIYTKLNGKLTSLIIDGKNIPEADYNKYSALLEKIEMVKEENKARRLIQFEHRKLAVAQKSEDLRNRTFERNLQRKYLTLQKQYLLEQNRQLRKLNKSDETLKYKRMELQKLLQKLQEKRMDVPRLNGREISTNDIHVDCPPNKEIMVKSDVNKQSNLVLQKLTALKTAPDNTLERKLAMKPEVSMAVKSRVNYEIDNESVNDFDYKPVMDKKKLPPEMKKEKSAISPESVPGIKIAGKAQPVKYKSVPVQPVKRRVTT